MRLQADEAKEGSLKAEYVQNTEASNVTIASYLLPNSGKLHKRTWSEEILWEGSHHHASTAEIELSKQEFQAHN